MAFDLLTGGGHVEGVRTGEHEAVASRRIVESQLLRDGPTLRVAEDRCRADGQIVEEAREVGCELPGRVRRREPAVPSVTAQVRNDHAMSRRELLDHRVEHFARDHEPVHEQQRRAGPSLGEVEHETLSLGAAARRAVRVPAGSPDTSKHNAPVGSRGR